MGINNVRITNHFLSEFKSRFKRWNKYLAPFWSQEWEDRQTMVPRREPIITLQMRSNWQLITAGKVKCVFFFQECWPCKLTILLLEGYTIKNILEAQIGHIKRDKRETLLIGGESSSSGTSLGKKLIWYIILYKILKELAHTHKKSIFLETF